MKRFLLLSGLIGLSAHAQKADSTRIHSEVYAQVEWELGSNGITTGALFDFFAADFLDATLKDKLTANTREVNNIGSFQDYEVGFRQWTDSTYNNWRKGFGLHLAIRSRFGAQVSSEALELSLYGNARFAGQTVEVLPLDNSSLVYTEFGYTYLQRYKQWSAALSGNLLLGHAYGQLETSRGTLYTEPSGEYIDLDAAYRYQSADSLLWLKGIGLSMHAEVSHTFNEKWGMTLGVRDLGLLFWNQSAWTIEADSVFRFEGQEIPNLLDQNGLDFGDLQDRFRSTFDDKQGGGFSTWLPARVYAEGQYQLNRWAIQQLRLRIDHVFIEGYRMRQQLKADMPLSGAWSLHPEISQGGWARWGIGLEARWKNADWEVRASAGNLQWMVVPNSSYGLGGMLSMTYRL